MSKKKPVSRPKKTASPAKKKTASPSNKKTVAKAFGSVRTIKNKDMLKPVPGLDPNHEFVLCS